MASPTVTSISPPSGPLAGGISVTIHGTNFTGTTGVTLGGTAATGVSVVDDSTITCTTPAHSAGAASVLVTNADGTNAANSLYTYQGAPTVTGISPASGPLTGGATVTITGTNFIGATGVTIGGAAAGSVSVVDATHITCTVPAGSAGAASVLVTTPSGTNAANTLYSYVAAPTVTSLSVSSGPTGGGTSVVITGTGFTGASSVSFGGTAVASYTVNNATTITCTVAAHSAGAVSVVVTTAGGSNAANTLYTYAAAPTVSGISAASGPLSGGVSVTITGTNFSGATGVTIGGAAATSVTVVDSTHITCTTPAHSAGTASVVVTTPGGSNAANSLYTYLAAPTVSSVSPASGTVNGGTSVVITGTGFTSDAVVKFGGVTATITSVSGTSITCTTPTGGGAGPASVQVTTPGGTNTANTLYSYVLTPPTVASVTPSSSTTDGGTTVTITGTNFSAVSSVTFGGVPATDVVVVSNTSLTCTTPAVGAPGGASVLVTTPSGTSAANSLFSYVPPLPTVGSLSPSTGSTLGGTLVSITGTHLLTTGSVTIGGVPATNVTVVSDTSITCITPAGSVGTPNVVVTTTGGSSVSVAPFTYALTAPTVSSISPAQGTSAGGTTVTVSGANFTGTTGVTIGGVAATRIVVVNDSTLTCTTPAGSAGSPRSVVVTTPNGSNAENSLFTYKEALPTVSSVSPPIGASAGGTSVTIYGTHFSGATGVTFGGLPATGITVVNDSTLTCTTPEGLAGTTSVLVTAAAGTSAANSLYLYVQAVPTDTYIYLKGARGDGFVPLWTGALSEEGMVSDTGTSLGTSGKEVSEPYRDIFPSTAFAQSTAVSYGGFAAWVVPGPGTGANLYLDDGTAATNSPKSRLSDEVGHVKPRQYARVATWLIFTSQSGISYKFRKDQVVGWGSQPRA
ncbi:beta strand repeat-containing protein [Prosthecobacter vanneervenii]|uniref:IPT/TIG domain-containing protein n=1 Tax=Prosthecobacter vanneervenii TaxID=48466 RepID=A0A7W7YG35_9BACT|nr:IPT/TIG domain-containing protein [Prosthecobacter vanneervenii]MBB5035561.1 hypothetical protein [Prosthecobacter vanneervenii]